MKTKKLLVLSLIALTSLVGCGESTGGDDDKGEGNVITLTTEEGRAEGAAKIANAIKVSVEKAKSSMKTTASVSAGLDVKGNIGLLGAEETGEFEISLGGSFESLSEISGFGGKFSEAYSHQAIKKGNGKIAASVNIPDMLPTYNDKGEIVTETVGDVTSPVMKDLDLDYSLDIKDAAYDMYLIGGTSYYDLSSLISSSTADSVDELLTKLGADFPGMIPSGTNFKTSIYPIILAMSKISYNYMDAFGEGQDPNVQDPFAMFEEVDAEEVISWIKEAYVEDETGKRADPIANFVDFTFDKEGAFKVSFAIDEETLPDFIVAVDEETKDSEIEEIMSMMEEFDVSVEASFNKDGLLVGTNASIDISVLGPVEDINLPMEEMPDITLDGQCAIDLNFESAVAIELGSDLEIPDASKFAGYKAITQEEIDSIIAILETLVENKK